MKEHIPTAKDYVGACHGEQEKFYSIFFQACRKFGVSWPDATDAEKAFIEEFTRFTFQSWKAEKEGRPLSQVKSFFGQTA